MASNAASMVTDSKLVAAIEARSGDLPRDEQNCSGNNYPKIKARIAQPIQKAARVGVGIARTIRESCKGTRGESQQNGQDDFDTCAHRRLRSPDNGQMLPC